MKLPRSLKWAAAAVLALLVLLLLLLALGNWNWLRAPLEKRALEQTGRVLQIKGQLSLQLGWPWTHIQAQEVTFANPAWALQPQLLQAQVIEFSIHVPQLLKREMVVSDLHLVRPLVFLELGADGRRTWLLDQQQQDERARVYIDRMTLDEGQIAYADRASQTSLQARLSSRPVPAGQALPAGVDFSVTGQFRGLPLNASGSGDAVLALRDEQSPYHFSVDTLVGQTHIQATGQVVSLLKLNTVDVQLGLSGNNLNQLYTLTGIAMPATRDYVTQGHLTHAAGTWRYERFSGRVGSSDLGGWLQLKPGAKRPQLSGDLVSVKLTLEDLGPLIGARVDHLPAARAAAVVKPTALAITPSSQRVIADLPFEIKHWNTVDVDVNFSAKSIRHMAYLPLTALSTRLRLKDSVLTLDPLQFLLADGQLNAVIALDGRHTPIQATIRSKIKNVALARLLPAQKKGPVSTSRISGAIILQGSGNSVGRMLASSNGSADLLVSGGSISQLLMEKAGLHLWEIFELTLTGDKPVKLRCAVANFDVKAGLMQAKTLEFDTEVTTLWGRGSIDLAQEKFDLTFLQKTKNTSPLALRSPIHLGGNFVKPVVTVDQRRLAARALGALALGAVNPLLSWLALIDAGPGKDSECAHWLRGQR